MLRPLKIKIAIVSVLLVGSLVGCDERVAEVAREAADRQADQNRTMAQLQQEVAGGTRLLVAADSEARKTTLSVHQDIQAERARIDEQWTALEKERKQIAAERRRTSALVPITKAIAGMALTTIVIGFCWHVLVRLRVDEIGEAELTEFLLGELAGTNGATQLASSSIQHAPALPVARPAKS